MLSDIRNTAHRALPCAHASRSHHRHNIKTRVSSRTCARIDDVSVSLYQLAINSIKRCGDIWRGAGDIVVVAYGNVVDVARM